MASNNLPGILGEIAQIVGEAAALKVAEAVGGMRVDIPAAPPVSHWLVELVGPTHAKAIGAHFAIVDADGRRKGLRHEIMPMGPFSSKKAARRLFALAMQEPGMTVGLAAKKAGVHERTGWRYVKDLRRNGLLTSDAGERRSGNPTCGLGGISKAPRYGGKFDAPPKRRLISYAGQDDDDV